MPKRIFLVVATALTLSGCFNGKLVVQQRAAKEFTCAEATVVVEELGGEAYRVTACGYRLIYVCNPRAGMCTRETHPAPVPQRPSATPRWYGPTAPGHPAPTATSPYGPAPPGQRPGPTAPPGRTPVPGAGPPAKPSPWQVPPAPGSSAFAW